MPAFRSNRTLAPLAAALAACLALPATAFAQGGGAQNLQNRPDFAFKVDIPADDARRCREPSWPILTPSGL